MVKAESTAYADYLREQNAIDDLYSAYQKRTGLSDAEFWCIYSAYKGECEYQHEISRHMFMNKQTVNSALKQLEKKGLIQMIIPQENQRVRRIVLTPSGKKFAHKYLDYIGELEEKAWESLSAGERLAILSGMKKINRVLSGALQIE